MGFLRRLLGFGPPRDPRAAARKNPYAIHDGGDAPLHPPNPRSADFHRGHEPPRRHDGARTAAPAHARGTGGNLTLDDLAARLDMTPASLIAVRAGYSRFTIPKRDGKPRPIDAPSPELKAVQRAILHRVLRGLPQHESAVGFTRGKSTLDAARLHTNRAVIVRLDIRDFFNTTSAGRIERMFRRIGWDAKASTELTRLCCHKGSLPQGAPTSPRLANLVSLRMDRRMAGMARSHSARYTRYADDITISFDTDAGHTIRSVVWGATQIASDEGYRLHTKRKLRIRRPHQRQEVLGLIVNNDAPRLPRETRRWLRAVEHHIATGRHATLTPAQLEGWRAYTAMIDRNA